MYQLALDNEMIVDNFAGGGGASCGIEEALNRPVNIAINHDPEAIAMHLANHPVTDHYCEDVWEINPRQVTKGRKIALAWFSPDCKHFSKAKGGRPVEKKIRGLAWVVLRWASLPMASKPRVIILENVEEFTTWGPLVDGKPCPDRKGQTFRAFVNALKRNGYIVEWKELRACDYGAPTIRKRLFLIARCDDQPIVWPKPTHGKGLLPYKTAAECIDWNEPAQSIFSRPRNLAENTLRRVAKGFKRFVIDAKQPFIVPVCHGEAPGQEARTHDINQPLPTIMGKGKYAFVTPYLTEHANASSPRVFAVDEPLRTQCAQVKGGHFALITPYLVGAGGSEYGGKPTSVEKPMGTITAENHKQAVMPFLAKHFGGVVGVRADTPLPTVTTRGTQTQIVAAYVSKMRGTNIGHQVDEPLHTVSAGGTHHALTSAFLIKYYGMEKSGQDLAEPMGTVTARDRFGLVNIETTQPLNLTDEQRYNAWWLIRLLEDFGAVPYTPALQSRPSFLMIDWWIVWGIGMRMLTPRELFRAQGFPDSYIIDRTADGKPLSKVAQVRMCGNSVSPVMSAALANANISLPALIRHSDQPRRTNRHASTQLI